VKNIAQACVQLGTNSEFVHQRILGQVNNVGSTIPLLYYRFNVDRDMQNIALQEWNKAEEMAAHTAAYMQEGERVVRRNRCVQDLIEIGIIDRLI
jgi:hypothetical protein